MRCGHCNGSHNYAFQVRMCGQGEGQHHVRARMDAASNLGNAQTRVDRETKPPSQAQLDYIEALARKKGVAGTVDTPVSSAHASRIITYLKKQRDAVNPDKPGFQIDYRMVSLIKDGRYAVRVSDDYAYIFVRVTRPTRGRLRGHLIVQTKHSDTLVKRLSFDSTGRLYQYKTGKISGQTIQEILTMIVVDQAEAAYNYARELNECCVCGKDLTDHRSRYFGIGPDCEKRFPHIINWVTEYRGEYVPV